MTTTAVKAERSGIVRLRVRLSRTGRQALARRGKVRTRLGVVFAPSGGGTKDSASRALAFRRGRSARP